MPKNGKPSFVRYQPALAKRICDELSAGRSLTEICQRPGMPDRHSVRRWVVRYPEFRQQYEAARLWWAHSQAEELVELADAAPAAAADAVPGAANAAVQALRLKIDTKKWMISRLLPADYGDRVTTTITGADGKDLIPDVEPSKIALALLGVLRSAKPAEALERPAQRLLREADEAPTRLLPLALPAPALGDADADEPEEGPPEHSRGEIVRLHREAERLREKMR